MDDMVTHSCIAIIPARGGSKRIPRKNIVDFHGQPMIAHTIDAALESGIFAKVIVSTDDEEIAAISRDYGAEVPFLRKRFADDHSPVSDVVKAALQELGVTEGNVAMLMANCPLREVSDLRSLYNTFTQGGHAFQLSAFDYGFANPWWAHEVEKGQPAIPRFPDALKQRSQDLPKLLCPTGACWLAKVPQFLEAGTFYGPDYQFDEIDRIAATDIDDHHDLAIARALYLVRQQERDRHV